MRKNRKAGMAEILVFVFGIVIVISVLGMMMTVQNRQGELVRISDVENSLSMMSDGVINAPECALYTEVLEINGEKELIAHRGIIDWDKLDEGEIDSAGTFSIPQPSESANCVTKGSYVWQLLVTDLETDETKGISSECEVSLKISMDDLSEDASVRNDISTKSTSLGYNEQEVIVGSIKHSGFITEAERIEIFGDSLKELVSNWQLDLILDVDELIDERVGYIRASSAPSITHPVTIEKNGTQHAGEATFVLGSKEFEMTVTGDKEKDSLIRELVLSRDDVGVNFNRMTITKLSIFKTGNCDATYHYEAYVVDENGNKQPSFKVFTDVTDMKISISGKKKLPVIISGTWFDRKITELPVMTRTIGAYAPYSSDSSKAYFLRVEAYPTDLPDYIKTVDYKIKT